MFHQANLRNADLNSATGTPAFSTPALSSNHGGDGATAASSVKLLSTLSAWVEAVVQGFNQYVTWPMITHKLDDHEKLFFDRVTRETAGVAMSAKYSEKGIAGISITAASACNAPVTLPVGMSASSVEVSPASALTSTEQIGTDPYTLWISLEPGSSVTLSFTTPIAF
jgi:hypothetical protein